MKAAIAVLIILALFLVGCKIENGNGEGGGIVSKEVSLKTDDGIEIKASYYPGNGDGVILLHMLPSDRHEWKQFAGKLQKLGYNVIAIDYRWQADPNAVHKDAVRDVKAARGFLNSNRIFIIGSSIGANLALNYAVSDSSVKGIVLLSPGENYRGVETFKAIRNYDRPVFIVSSQDDGQSIDASRQLSKLARGEVEFKEYKDAGHGTNMFVKPDLADSIIDWLDKYK